MQEMGFEPTRIATADFESAASTIPPLLRCRDYVITTFDGVQIIPPKKSLKKIRNSVDMVILS